MQAGLDGVEVLVEHQLPLTSQRADVVLCGVHPRTRQPSYVVVELKQWSSASLLEDSGGQVLGGGGELGRRWPSARSTEVRRLS